MTRKNRSKNKNYPNQPNFYGMLQNILITAMNKGQLPGMTIALILIVLLVRYPAEDLPILVSNILSISMVNSILGWVLWGITIFTSFFVIRWQRRIHTREVKRISEEKKNLQEQLSKKELPSSNK